MTRTLCLPACAVALLQVLTTATRRLHVAASPRTATRRRAGIGVFAGLPLPTPAALHGRCAHHRAAAKLNYPSCCLTIANGRAVSDLPRATSTD